MPVLAKVGIVVVYGMLGIFLLGVLGSSIIRNNPKVPRHLQVCALEIAATFVTPQDNLKLSLGGFAVEGMAGEEVIVSERTFGGLEFGRLLIDCESGLVSQLADINR